MAPTVRRHPRSMVEAWPKTVEYACAITRYSNPSFEATSVIAGVICLVVLVFIAVGVF